MRYDLQIVIDVFGHGFDPDEVTLLLKVAPDHVAREGVRTTSPVAPRQNVWSVRSTPANFAADLQEHWVDLEARIEGREGAFHAVSDFAKVRFTVLARRYVEVFPLVEIPIAMTKYIAACGRAGFEVVIEDFTD